MPGYIATVTVRLKEGVLDPEAETTRRALERLKYPVSGLRRADYFEVDFDASDEDEATAKAEEMTKRLLANPTIHDYAVEVEQQ